MFTLETVRYSNPNSNVRTSTILNCLPSLHHVLLYRPRFTVIQGHSEEARILVILRSH